MSIDRKRMSMARNTSSEGNSSVPRRSSSRWISVAGAVAVIACAAVARASFARPEPTLVAPLQKATEEEVLKEIKSKGDAVKPELVKDLANFRTRTAMQSLIELLDSFETVFMKREVVRALVKFDGVAEAEQPALQKLMDVATQSKEVELRTAAVDSLGECGVHGKDFLVLIVESAADDLLRERAMQSHLRLHDKSDLDWYRQLYKPKKDDDDKAKKPKKNPQKPDPKKPDPKKPGKGDKDAKDKEGDDAPAEDVTKKKGRILPNIRLGAFEALVSNMAPEEVTEALADEAWKIRLKALEELGRRKDAKLADIAQKTLEKSDPTGSIRVDVRIQEVAPVRCLAARIVAELQGAKIADEFVKRGGSVDTPQELRNQLATLVGGFNDEKVNRQLLNDLTGRGKPEEKLFLIQALKGLQEDKVSRGLEHLLLDKDTDVVVHACKAIAERKQKESADKLMRLVGKGKEKNAMRAALDALTVVRHGDPAWIDQLLDYTKYEDPEVRNLALQALGTTKDKKALDKLVAALQDPNWSVRLAALDALEHLKTKEAIGPIIERMAKEEGRMAQEFSLALWRLTGQGFQENAQGWDNWWKASADRFEFLTEEQLNAVKTGEDDYKLRQTTRVEQKFFGIRIVSHRVIFIIDVSGSMVEILNSEYEGKGGQQRIDVAKRELERCVQGLDPSAMFNIITFSSDVDRWLDGSLSVANEKNRGEAKTFASKLSAGGGTNIYGAMKEAFQDPDVDTIFFLSDGEPSVGDEIDPLVIREHVKAWNEHRGIQINTIAIGGQFQVLEWLAADSGGTHVRFD